MKPFNLAESRIAERARCRQYVNRRLRSILLLVILTVAVAVTSYSCDVAIVRAKSTYITSELADVTSRCVELKREIASIKERSGQRNWQRQLSNQSERLLDVLGAILTSVPSDVWLSRVQSSEKDSSVTLEAQASSFESLSRFIDALRRSGKFSEVRLANSKVSELGDGLLVDFSLNSYMRAQAGGASATSAAATTEQVPEIKGGL